MQLSQKISSGVRTYIQLFNESDAESLTALFSPDAEVHDPVGTPAKIGHTTIRAYYNTVTKNGSKLIQKGDLHISGHEAALNIQVQVNTESDEYKSQAHELPQGQMVIDLIDVFTFNEAGKITLMRGYWGPDNIQHK